MKKYLTIVIILAVLGGVALVINTITEKPTAERTKVAETVYQCDNGKTISTAFYDYPIATSTVEVSLDGAASTTLTQTISADGARYANDDESFVFWNKGTGAIIMRNNKMDLGYRNCATQSND